LHGRIANTFFSEIRRLDSRRQKFERPYARNALRPFVEGIAAIEKLSEQHGLHHHQCIRSDRLNPSDIVGYAYVCGVEEQTFLCQ
jgi:hypothetical protein